MSSWKKADTQKPWSLAHGWIMSTNAYWPPKGKPLGMHIADWSAPGTDWKCFDIIETIFESGSKDTADQMINMPTTEESDSDVDG